MRALGMIMVSGLAAGWAGAQTPTMVSSVEGFPQVNRWLEPMLASDGATAYFWSGGLWKTDGTAGGTVKVCDGQLGDLTAFIPTPVSSVICNGVFVMNVTPSISGAGSIAWSDGTPGSYHFVPGMVSATGLTSAAGLVFFQASTNAAGAELWVFDPVTHAAHMVKDIRPGSADALFQTKFMVWNDRVYFAANDGTGGALWTSDGTEAGTHRVTSPGTLTGGPVGVVPAGVVVLGNDAAHGWEFWISDGTAGGTRMISDLTPGPDSTEINMPPSQQFPTFGGSLFAAVSEGGGRYRMFRTDGTEAGSGFVSASWGLLRINGAPLYDAGPCGVVGRMMNAGNDTVLMRTDGTAAGTRELSVFAQSVFYGYTPFGSGLLFPNSDPVNGWELWFTDGTAAGTRIVGTPAPGDAGLGLDIRAVGSKAVYRGTDDAGDSELFVTNGTTAGQLRELLPDNVGTPVGSPIAGSGGAFFVAGSMGEQLYFTDGTPAGTHVVATDSHDGISAVFATDGWTYFNAYDPVYAGTGLWRTNGTAGGTSAVRVNDPIYGGNAVDSLIPFTGGRAIASAYLAPHGMEPAVTDGTAAGTALLANINPGGSSSYPKCLTRVGDMVYFSADDGVHGRELWVTDGTPGGTHAVIDLLPGPGGGFPFNPNLPQPTQVAVGSELYFIGVDGDGPGLFRSSGTAGGTALVCRLGSNSGLIQSLCEFNGRCYFWGIPESDPETRGLWSADASGATLVRAFPAGVSYPMLKNLLVANGVLYFEVQSDNPLSSTELWRSDGTGAGTTKVTDVWPTSVNPPKIQVMPGGPVYFLGHRTTTGLELFRSNGTDSETLPVEVVPGPGSSVPGLMRYGTGCRSGDNFYFTADDGVHGPQVWTLAASALIFPPSCPADFNGDGFLDFFDYDDYVGCFETGACPPGTTADFNGDDFVDFFDYDDFVSAFETGC